MKHKLQRRTFERYLIYLEDHYYQNDDHLEDSLTNWELYMKFPILHSSVPRCSLSTTSMPASSSPTSPATVRSPAAPPAGPEWRPGDAKKLVLIPEENNRHFIHSSYAHQHYLYNISERHVLNYDITDMY